MRLKPATLPLILGGALLLLLAAATIERWTYPKCADNEMRMRVNGVSECIVINWPRGSRGWQK